IPHWAVSKSLTRSVRCAGGVTLIRALTWNVRTCSAMPKEKAQAATTVRPKSTGASGRGGPSCSSDEAGVMLVEQRGRATGIGTGQPEPSGKGRSPILRRKAVAFQRWHEPDDARVSSPVVCPVKAGVFSRRQTCRGKSQASRSLDGRVEGNQDSEAHRQGLPRGDHESPGRNESERESGLESE